MSTYKTTPYQKKWDRNFYLMMQS